MRKTLLPILIILGFISFSIPSLCTAFEAVKYDSGAEVNFYGFLRNNLGVFEHTQEFTNSGNQLATARTWLRAYGDLKFSDQWRAFIAAQFVYEPWYPVEEGGSDTVGFTRNVSKHNGNEYSEFKDVNDILREVNITWSPNKKTSIKFGRQIVIWGEALTSRVGDVVHPEDDRFAFGFSNLEDTRIPQYMIRGIHDISALNSSFEWIINPLLVGEEYRVNRLPTFYTTSNGAYAEQRFAVHSPDQTFPFPFQSFPNAFNLLIPYNGMINNRYPVLKERFPKTDFSDMRYGFRTGTFLGGYQFGMQYFHTQLYSPITQAGPYMFTLPLPIPYQVRTNIDLVHPNYDIIGLYMNKQLSKIPGVIRAEVAYSPNMPFNTFNVAVDEDGIVRRDNVKYMIAYDLNSFLYFDWHKTAAFDVTIEHVGEWTPNSNDLQFAIYNTKYPTYMAGFNIRIATNWFYNRFVTELVAGYNTFGNSGLIMPAVKWQPGWLDQKFSAELKYIGIFGDNDYEGLGVLKKKDMILLTTQFNF